MVSISKSNFIEERFLTSIPSFAAFVKNAYLASYFRLSTQMEAAEEEDAETSGRKAKASGKKAKDSAVETHAKEVLNILNNGNLKELQILPLIGLKTAYQIMSYR